MKATSGKTTTKTKTSKIMPSESSPKLEWFETEDGSRTLRDLELDVTYRSSHGAQTESQHVFVNPVAGRKESLKVFEFGFGLGTNFVELRRAHPGPLTYKAVEHRPLPKVWEDVLGWDATLPLKVGGVELEVQCKEFAMVELESDFDVVFHDPFGPSANPDAWSVEVFEREFNALSPHGILLTYSSAGHVRRALEDVGFRVLKRPGPGRKREVIAALKSNAARELWAL